MKLNDQIWARVRKEVSTEAQAWVAEWLKHQLLWVSFDEKYLLPGAARQKLELLQRTGTDNLSADELLERINKLAELKRIADHPAESSNARRSLNALYFAQRQSFDNLAEAVEKSLAAQSAELEKAETEFFATFDMDREQTAVSRTIVTAAAGFALKVSSFHAGCRMIENMPTGEHTPHFEFENFAMLFDAK